MKQTGEGIRPMAEGDIEAIAAIELAVFPVPWSAASFQQELHQNHAARYLVLQWEGEIAAYGGMWFVLDEAHITNIAVSPAHRRKGFGKAILQALLVLAQENGMRFITLETRRSNLIAQALYHQMGFQDVGYRKRYYSDNQEDALIMYKEFHSSSGEDT